MKRVTFRNVLAFENFVLLMGVVFGLQFIDRTFGPVLPLYVAELGVPPERVPIAAPLTAVPRALQCRFLDHDRNVAAAIR